MTVLMESNKTTILTGKKESKNVQINDSKELAEFIADHLPISSEDAWHFVDGALKGCLFNDKINFTIALSLRDKWIKELEQENKILRKRLFENK